MSLRPEKEFVAFRPEKELVALRPEKEFVVAERGKEVVPHEPKTEVVAFEFKKEIVTSESNKEVVSHEPKTEIVTLESENEIVASEPEKEIAAFEPEKEVVIPETKKEILEPEKEVATPEPVSPQLSSNKQVIAEFIEHEQLFTPDVPKIPEVTENVENRGSFFNTLISKVTSPKSDEAKKDKKKTAKKEEAHVEEKQEVVEEKGKKKKRKDKKREKSPLEVKQIEEAPTEKKTDETPVEAKAESTFETAVREVKELIEVERLQTSPSDEEVQEEKLTELTPAEEIKMVRAEEEKEIDKKEEKKKKDKKAKRQKSKDSTTDSEICDPERQGVFESIVAKISEVFSHKKSNEVILTAEQVLAVNLNLDGPFWLDKSVYDEAEESYQTELAKKKSAAAEGAVKAQFDDAPDKDGDSDSSSGRGSPRPPQQNGELHANGVSGGDFRTYSLPGGVGGWKDRSTYLQVEESALAKIKTADEHLRAAKHLSESIAEDVIAESSLNPPLGPPMQPTISAGVIDGPPGGDRQLKKDLTEDVAKLQKLLQTTEISIEYLPREGFDQMIRALEEITSDLKKHATQAISLEGQVLELKSDHETQALAVHLAGIRTRIATLLSQAEHGRIAVTNARESHVKRQEELTQYQLLLTEIEVWLQTARQTIEAITRYDTQAQIETSIDNLNRLNRELDVKEKKLEELSKVCEEFKKYPDLKQLAETLVEQLRTLTLIFGEQRIVIRTKIDNLSVQLVQLKESKSPDLSLENTLDSASMPIEESPIVGVNIETQTGRSLASPLEEPATKDFTVTYNVPVDVQIQTQLSESPSEVEASKHKETITISKTIADGAETIQIATKPMASESQPLVEEPDDLLVEANYRKQTETQGKSTELNITNAKPNQPFETVFVEPDETTTEVIVDADGTKRIIVKKLHRTVVRHQQTVQQQQLTSTSTLAEGEQPPVTQSFSQVTLKEQQSSTTLARGDGSRQTVTSKQYGGKIVSGVPGGDVDVQEFQTEPQTHYSVVEAEKPSEVEIEGIKLHEGDVTFIDQQNKLVSPEHAQVTFDGSQIHTSSSSVRAVVQQVTRRVIRKTRRIIRRIVVVDGKEHITEEIVEEPEEVEVTEEGIPRVSINVTRTEDGKVVQEQQFGEPVVVVEEPGTSVTKTVTAAVFDGKPIGVKVTEEGERYVVEPTTAPQPESAQLATEPVALVSERSTETISASKDFIESERLALSSYVEAAPSLGDAPEKPTEKDKETPRDELSGPASIDLIKTVEAATQKSPPSEEKVTQLEEVSKDDKISTIVAQILTPPTDESPIASPMQVETTKESLVEISETSPAEVTQTIIQTVTTPVVSIREVEKVSEEPETGQPTTKIEVTETTVKEPEETKEETVREEVDATPKIIEETVLKTMQINGDVKLKDIGLITQDFITSQQFHEPEPLQIETTPKTEEEEYPSSPKDKGKKKRKFSKTKKVSGTPRTQSPDVPADEDVSIQPKEPSQIEIALSLKEKPADPSFVAPEVSVVMTVEENKSKSGPAEMLQKDIHVTLPAVSHSKTAVVKSVALSPITPKLESEHVESPTPSDIDHGGRGSKKKKKHKEETPSEEIEIEEKEVSVATSVAESTEIIMPEDSLPSEETPKPTQEVFEPVTESEEEEAKDTGYEADKTTVDESLADDDNQEQKKRRKKKRKQKIKVKESEESNIPKSAYESSPFGESVPLTDDEPAKVETVKVEETKKAKKRRKGKREESKLSESEHEIESEPAILEAQDEEIMSPNESYHTISTQSDLGTVKVIEEGIVRPASESPQEITEKIVTTVPVLEAVITQETLSQTSPELNQVIEKFIEQEQVATEPVSVQTSPEVPKEIGEISIQTSREPSPEIIKPEIQDSSSQVEIATTEIVTQTDTPEKVEIVTSEISMQTATPEQVEVVEEGAQTISPEVVEIPRSESAMQTTIVESHEESAQTKSPELQVTETAVQAQPTPAEHSIQTSPEPSAPPYEEVFAEEIAKQQPEIVEKPETSEIVTQTSPVLIHEITELTPPSSLSEQYEVLVEASVMLPSESTETVSEKVSKQPVKKSEELEVKVQPEVKLTTEPSEESHSENSSSEDVDVEVYVDGEPIGKPKSRKKRRRKAKKEPKEPAPTIEKDLMSAFKRQEDGGRLDPKELYSEVAKKHSRSSSPVRPEEMEEAIVVGKVITDLDQDKVKKLTAKPKGEESFNISVEIAPKETPSSSPDDFEIISEDVMTKPFDEGDYEVTTTVQVLPAEEAFTVTQEQQPEVKTTIKTEVQKSTIADFIASEKAAAEIPPPQKVPSEVVVVKKEPQVEDIKEEVEAKQSVTEEIMIQESVKPVIERDLVDSLTEENKTTEEMLSQESKTEEFVATLPIEVKKGEPDEPKKEPKGSPTKEPEQKPKIPSPKPKHKPKHISSVTIEEIESPIAAPDLPISPPSDYSLSPPADYPSRPVWQTRQQASKLLIESERQQSPVTAQDLDIRWTHTQALERVKNLQNARKTTHLSDVLYLATLHEVVTDESIEQRSYNVQENLNTLKEAVEKRDVVIIQQTIITTVETITTWLETIEYRIYVNRQQTADGPSKERVQEFNNLKEEIVNIEEKVEQLQSVMKQADDIYNEDDRKRMKSYIDSLQQQVKVIEEVTSENEQLAAGDLKRWEEFINGVADLTNLINEVKKQLDDLKDSDAAPQTKLNELDKIEHGNRCNMLKAVHLIATAKGLMRDFPTREIPKEVYSNHENTKFIEQQVVIEREKALQFLSLADEYEQTLKEFGQIIDVAEALVESPINVSNLEHLEDAMQNHRKFFVNLSHCRAILESLEENLDSETRMHHSELHRSLYDRAKVILDQATGRFQQMSLAASRWTVLEQGMREEIRWLQVAQQRVPDLSNVTSSDYDRYIDLYQSLALDIAHHHAKIVHLNGVAQKLQELVVCSGLEEAYIESLEIILKLQDDVQNNLKRLLTFRDSWTTYNMLSDKVEYWLRDAEQQLQQLEVPSGPRGHMRQFWELKAQHEELEDLKTDVDNLRGIIKTEEELNLYIERLQVMSTRLETIQNELGRLGLLSATESDKVGSLLALSKRLEILIAEELEGGVLLKERLQNIQKGIARVRRKHSGLEETLDQCEQSEKLGSEAVEKAVNECYEVGEELVTLWQDLMGLRQLLHTLPMRLHVTVSPVKVERDISQLQDEHTALEKRCGQLLALLRNRLALWQRFEHQLEMVQQSVQEADFMMELLTVQGTVDYERLRKATERLESVSVDLVSRETLVAELKAAAKPLSDSCAPEISAKVEAAVEEAVTAYSTTCTNLKDLCTKYQHAAELWKRYREASDLVSEWVDNHMESVGSLEPEEAIKAVKI
ncbi:hypothetical protein BDFB_000182 [Asbolus verrucosus]|uniref:Nesprin-1 n=1 Tax=Asbolus verrucosus TaxID=1661398 RepID=A0A482VEV5_ASBVE|nr:hypothetical protein BDFB_000182 [Asbolus verrucosus]